MREALQKELFQNHPSLQNKYMIEDRIGGGSFGDIYSALNLESGESIAIKVEKKSGKHLQTLKREARVLQVFKGEKGFPLIHLFAQASQLPTGSYD